MRVRDGDVVVMTPEEAAELRRRAGIESPADDRTRAGQELLGRCDAKCRERRIVRAAGGVVAAGAALYGLYRLLRRPE